MKYRGIFEYEYPIEHKPPVSIDVNLHGDCVKGKIIEWEYRPLEQEPILDKIRAEIMDCLKALDEIEKFNIYLPNEMSGRRLTYKQCLGFIDKYKAESEDKK